MMSMQENNDLWSYQKHGNLKMDMNIPDEIFPKEITVKILQWLMSAALVLRTQVSNSSVGKVLNFETDTTSRMESVKDAYKQNGMLFLLIHLYG